MLRYRGAVETALVNLAVRDLAGLERVGFVELDRHLRALHLAGRARSTIVGVVAALRSFLEYATLVGALARNPGLELRGPSVTYRPEAPHLRPGEVERLIYGARPGWLPRDWRAARDRVMLAVSFACGLRVSEPGRLRFEDVAHDEATGRWSVLVRGSKWADQDVRATIRDDRIGRLFAHWVTSLHPRYRQGGGAGLLFPSTRGGGALSARQVQRIFRAAVVEAGLRPRGRRLSFHILRHTLATLCAEAGWELRAIQRLMRHRTERTTLRYVHTRDERLERLWTGKHPLRRGRGRQGGEGLVQEIVDVLGAASGS